MSAASRATSAPTDHWLEHLEQTEKSEEKKKKKKKTGLLALDAVSLEDHFRRRVLTLQGVPARLRGALRAAMRAGLRLAVEGASPEDAARGWKLFFLAPRMLLFRSPGETRVAPEQLDRRGNLFQQGLWPQLLADASRAAPTHPRNGSSMPDDTARAARAAALVHLGELSAAGRALVCGPVAPGSEATLAELRDPARRPSEPYGPIAGEVLEFQPPKPCLLPLAAFVAGLRGARRGSAAGPSGATRKHLRILLDGEEDTLRLHVAAERVATAPVVTHLSP